jgi:hypothetical protein
MQNLLGFIRSGSLENKVPFKFLTELAALHPDGNDLFFE